jgi:NADPH:quinone reductase-like Zn-dependent oxidoreductase
MRIVQYTAFGDPKDVVRVVDAPSPVAGAGEVVVTLEASPVHLADLKSINGLKWFRVPSFPATPGFEGVGRISAIGPSVTGWSIGDRVFLPMAMGAWREEAVVAASALWRAPEGIPAEQLALVPINVTTAYRLIEDTRPLAPGDWIIQNAANSNVGHYLIRLARLRGYKTVNVVRRPELIPQLTALGGDAVLVDGPDLAARVQAATGGGNVMFAIDAVAGAATQRLAECLSGSGGVVATYGLLSGEMCQIAPEEVMFRGVTHTGFMTSRSMAKMTPNEIAAMRDKIVAFIEKDMPHVPIAGVYRFSEIHVALAHAGRVAGERDGKVILVP